jgi:hypothetical protein
MKTQRIILDENFSDGLAIALRKLGHNVVSVHETEWVGFKNGALGASKLSLSAERTNKQDIATPPKAATNACRAAIIKNIDYCGSTGDFPRKQHHVLWQVFSSGGFLVLAKWLSFYDASARRFMSSSAF